MSKDDDDKRDEVEDDEAEAEEEESDAPAEDDADDDDADDDDADEDDADDDDADDDDADDDDADEDDADEDDADDDDADDDDADDDDADDDDADEDAPPPPKKKARSKASGGSRRHARPAARRRVQRGSPTRNILLFVFLVGGLAAAFGVLGNKSRGQGPKPTPKWKVGQTVDLEVTLVTTDYKNLGCAMPNKVGDNQCAFESQNKRAEGVNSNSRENPNLLQPYTTVDRVQFLGAGLWTQPDLKKKLDSENWDRPSPRFTVKCKYEVEGRAKGASVQWKPGEGWHSGNGWYVGTLKNCNITG